MTDDDFDEDVAASSVGGRERGSFEHGSRFREITDLPLFYGRHNEDWTEYLSIFDRYSFCNKPSDARKCELISTRLRGYAASVWDNLDEETRLDWPRLVAAMNKALVSPNIQHTYLTSLHNRKQQKKETVDMYLRVIQSLGQKAYPDLPPATRDQHLLHFFIRGLREPLATRVQVRMPEDLHTASVVAKTQESYLEASSARPSTPPEATIASLEAEQRSSSSGHESQRGNEHSTNFSGNGRGGLSSRGSDRNRFAGRSDTPRHDKSQLQCHECQGFGHFARECPNGRRPDDRNRSDGRRGGFKGAVQQYSGRGTQQERRPFASSGNPQRRNVHAVQAGDDDSGDDDERATVERLQALLLHQQQMLLQQQQKAAELEEELDYCYSKSTGNSGSGRQSGQRQHSASGINILSAESVTASDPVQVNLGSLQDNRSPHHIPLVLGKVKDGPAVHIFADGGSEISVISESFFRRIPLYMRKRRADGTPVLAKAFFGSEVKLTQVVEVDVLLCGHEMKHHFYIVPNSPYRIVIGNDFLNKHRIDVCHSRHCLQLPSGKTCEMQLSRANQPDAPSFKRSDTDPYSCNVRLLKTTVIGPREGLILDGIPERKIDSDVGVVDPYRKSSPELFTARAIVCVDEEGNIPVPIVNASSDSIKLYAGTRIAVLSAAEIEPEGLPVQANILTEGSSQKNDSDAFLAEIDLSNADATPEQKEILLRTLRKYSAAFSQDEFDLGRCKLVQHVINTGDHPPIHQKPYRIAQCYQKPYSELLRKFKEHGLIRESTSPWSSPVVIVPKKDGGIRFTIDLRKLNSITKKDRFPLPRIDETLDSLAGASYYSSLDLNQGFYQLELQESEKEKTAFSTPEGLFELNVLPMGLTNSPGTFQRTMEKAFAGLQWRELLLFVDDTLVFSKDFKGHIERLEHVFQRLIQANLKLKPRKCHFLQRVIKFLGHEISKAGIGTDPAKVEAIRALAIPTCLRELRIFMGMVTYYKKFVPNLAKVAMPLYRLERKDVQFEWTTECNEAFEALKRCLMSSEVMAFPDFTKMFRVTTDASKLAVGAVLSQLHDGQERPIAYESRQLSKAEKNYSTLEQEALGVIFAVRKFRPYLLGREFEVFTDHRPLVWLLTLKEPQGRLARWAMLLSDYNMTVVYKEGKLNLNADALSRLKRTDFFPEEETVSINAVTAATFQGLGSSIEHLADEQRKDSNLKAIIDYIEKRLLPDDVNVAREIVASEPVFSIEDGILIRLWSNKSKGSRDEMRRQIVVPESMKAEILAQYHDSPTTGGHLSARKGYHSSRQQFYWYRMYLDFVKYVNSCDECGKRKPIRTKTKAPLQPLQIPSEAWQHVSIDCIGPLPRSSANHEHIVLFVDHLTRYIEAFPVSNIKTKTISRLFINEICCRYGCPKVLQSDRGASLTAELLKDVCELFRTKKIESTSYHPATQGLVERSNGTIIRLLRMYVNAEQRDWHTYLPLVLFCYRISIQDSLLDSPFYLNFGRDPRTPFSTTLQLPELSTTSTIYRCELTTRLQSARSLVKSNLERAQQRQKVQFDKHASSRTFSVGQLVRLHDPTTPVGLSPKFQVPYPELFRITEQRGPATFVIHPVSYSGKSQLVPAERLKPVFNRDTAQASNEEGEECPGESQSGVGEAGTTPPPVSEDTAATGSRSNRRSKRDNVDPLRNAPVNAEHRDEREASPQRKQYPLRSRMKQPSIFLLHVAIISCLQLAVGTPTSKPRNVVQLSTNTTNSATTTTTTAVPLVDNAYGKSREEAVRIAENLQRIEELEAELRTTTSEKRRTALTLAINYLRTHPDPAAVAIETTISALDPSQGTANALATSASPDNPPDPAVHENNVDQRASELHTTKYPTVTTATVVPTIEMEHLIAFQSQDAFARIDHWQQDDRVVFLSQQDCGLVIPLNLFREITVTTTKGKTVNVKVNVDIQPELITPSSKVKEVGVQSTQTETPQTSNDFTDLNNEIKEEIMDFVKFKLHNCKNVLQTPHHSEKVKADCMSLLRVNLQLKKISSETFVRAVEFASEYFENRRNCVLRTLQQKQTRRAAIIDHKKRNNLPVW